MPMTPPEVRSAAAGLLGCEVRLVLPGDEFFGGAVSRWGRLVSVTEAHLVLDDYHESSGLGAGPGGQRDGVRVPLAEIRHVGPRRRGA
jgi:hypothetical protein